MKTIEESEHVVTIVLEENDKLKIETMWGNPIQLLVEVRDGVILVDEVSVRSIHNIKEEAAQVKALEKYIEK